MPGGQKKQRGDTIVEVMVVLAILGLALGICYATANRSLLNTRQAQENSEASELVQSQIEALRNMAGNTSGNDDIFTHNGPFCVSTSSGDHIEPTTDSSCTNQDSFYNLSVVYGPPEDSKSFKVIASWDDVEGQGTDTVTMYYRLNPGQAGSGGSTSSGCAGAPADVVADSDLFIAPGAPNSTAPYSYMTTTDQKVAGGEHGPTLVFDPNSFSTAVPSPVICLGDFPRGVPNNQPRPTSIVGDHCELQIDQDFSVEGPYTGQSGDVGNVWLSANGTTDSTGVINSDGTCSDPANPDHTVFLQNTFGTGRIVGPFVVQVQTQYNTGGYTPIDGTALDSSVSINNWKSSWGAQDLSDTWSTDYYWNYLIACPNTNPTCSPVKGHDP